MSAIALLLALSTPAFAEEAPPIVGGARTSDFEQVGALVAVSGNSGGSFCSGTLVHRKWAVTAAHCVEAAQEYLDYNYDVYFVVGTDVYSSSGWDDYAVVSRAIPHPGYGGNSIANDIGLLEFDGSLTSVPPMPMNTRSPSGFGNIDVTYVGFGITGDNQNDGGVKRTVDVAYYSYDSQFIYTYESGVNICSGDSGGAALIERDGDFYLAGANSFGFNINGGAPNCEGNGAAAGSARVDAYMSWIEDYVPDDDGSGGSDGGGSDGGGSDGGGSDGGGSDGGGSDGGGAGDGGGPSDEPEPGDADFDRAEELGSTDAVEFPTACSSTGAGGGSLGLAMLGLLAGFVRRREG